MASLFRRATLFLEDGDFSSTGEYLDRVLDIDPEYAPAYMGKLCVSLQRRTEAALAEMDTPFDQDANY